MSIPAALPGGLFRVLPIPPPNFSPPSATTDAATQAYVDTQVSGVKDIIGTGPLHTGACLITLHSKSQPEYNRGSIYVLDSLVYVPFGRDFSYEYVTAVFNRNGIHLTYYNSNYYFETRNSISTNMLEDHYGVSWKLIFGVGWRDLTSITLGDPNRYGYTITTI